MLAHESCWPDGGWCSGSIIAVVEEFQWAASSLRGELEGVRKNLILLRIESGEAVVSCMALSEWATGVVGALQSFISYARKPAMKETKVKSTSASSTGEDVQFVDEEQTFDCYEALHAQYTDICSKGGASSLEDLKNLSCWRHLLTDVEKRNLMEWRDSLVKAVPKAKLQHQPKNPSLASGLLLSWSCFRAG